MKRKIFCCIRYFAAPEGLHLKKLFDEKSKERPLSPARRIILSFMCLIIFGTLMLMLPFSSKGEPLGFLTALYTATSATCVTGLTLIDPFLDLTLFGQMVLALLIECGGLGLLTFVSFFMFSISKKAGLHSLQLAQETTAAVDFRGTRQLVKTIFTTSFAIQSIGAAVLALRFVPRLGSYGAWVSVFTSVSAYCNAGFDLMGFEGKYSSLVNYNGDPLVMYTVMALIIMGGIGFIVFQDIINFRKTHRLLLHTRVVLVMSAALIAFGFFSFLVIEYENPKTIGDMPLFEKINAALFQSIATRTAGFSSINLGEMHDLSKFIYIMLMFIGAGSGSTGGGIKVTTFAVVASSVISVIRGRREATLFGRIVNRYTVYKAVAITALAVIVVMMCGAVILMLHPDLSGIDGIFEAVSAFGTVGSTTGVTGIIGTPEKIAEIITMFIGRVGPISFVIAVTLKNQMNKNLILPEGKIMVG